MELSRQLVDAEEQDAHAFFLAAVYFYLYESQLGIYASNAMPPDDSTNRLSKFDEGDLEKLLAAQRQRIAPLNLASLPLSRIPNNANEVLFQPLAVTDALCYRALHATNRETEAIRLLDTILEQTNDSAGLVDLMPLLVRQKEHAATLRCIDKWWDLIQKDPLSPEASETQRKNWNLKHQVNQALMYFPSVLGAIAPNHPFDELLARSLPLLKLPLLDASSTQRATPTRATSIRVTSIAESFAYGEEQVLLNDTLPMAVSTTTRSQVRCALALFVIADRQQKVDDLLSALEKAKEAQPPSVVTHLSTLRSFVLWSAKRKPEAVEQLFEQFENAKDADALLKLAQLALQFNGYELALEMLEQVQTDLPSLQLQREWFRLEASEQLGDVEQAKQSALFLMGMRLSSQDRLKLISTLDRLQLPEEANRLREQSLTKSKNDLASLTSLMESFAQAGKTETANQIAERILLHVPTRNPRGEIDSATRMAQNSATNLLSRNGGLAALRERLEKQYLANPSSTRIQQQLMNLSSAMGSRSGMVGNQTLLNPLREAIAKSPRNASLRLELCRLLDQFGQQKEVAEHLVWLLENRPDLLQSYSTYLQKIQDPQVRPILAKSIAKIDINRLPDPNQFLIHILRFASLYDPKDLESLIDRLVSTQSPAFADSLIQLVGNQLPPDTYYRLITKNLLPTSSQIKNNPWCGFKTDTSTNYFVAGNAGEASVVSRLARIQTKGLLSRLKEEMESLISKHPEWNAGPWLLALIDQQAGETQACEKRLTELLAQPSVFESWDTLDSAGRLVLAQQIGKYPKLQVNATQLLERVLPSSHAASLDSYLGHVRQLNEWYLNQNETEKVRTLMRRFLTSSSNTRSSFNVQAAYCQMFAEQLKGEVHQADKLLLSYYANPSQDPNSMMRSTNLGPNVPAAAPISFKQVFDELRTSTALAPILRLLQDPSLQVTAEKDLNLFFTKLPPNRSLKSAKINSDLWNLILSRLNSNENRVEIEKAIGMLVQKYPESIPIASLNALVTLQAASDQTKRNGALEHLIQCCERVNQPIHSRFRLNFDAYSEQTLDQCLWLVADACQQHPEHEAMAHSLAQHTIAIAERYANRFMKLFVMRHQAQWAMNKGDSEGALTTWRQMVDTLMPQKTIRHSLVMPEKESPEQVNVRVIGRLSAVDYSIVMEIAEDAIQGNQLALAEQILSDCLQGGIPQYTRSESGMITRPVVVQLSNGQLATVMQSYAAPCNPTTRT